MVALRYATGDAYVIATGDTVALIDADTPSDLLTGVWDEVNAGHGLAAVLEALTGAFGTSLTAIPPFLVAVDEPEGLRLAVRGDIHAHVTGAGEPVTVTGVGVTTWSERVVSGAARAEIRLGSASPTAPLPLALRDGIVRASALVAVWDEDAAATPTRAVDAVATEVDVTPDDGASAAAEPEPEPEPEREPEPEPTSDEEAAAASRESSSQVLTGSGADTWLPGDATLAPLPDRSPEADDDGEAASSTPELGDVADTVASVRVRGDHDGETISLAQARAMRGETPAAAPLLEPLAPPRMPAPARLRLSTGQTVLLDRTVVIGRRPRSTRVTGTDLPHLIAVESPEQDISRSHLEVRVEGDSVLATDLHTTNGTTLRRAGADPVRLHPGERNVVVPGDVLDLGDGVLVTVEDIA
ncbi:FHA domain-containing protein [Microbacterium terrisoli]|uniref:FHA domain-containing protein n=1 Tax=Microbacterium terrisoli TaxID=3242192 RepID=UPI0028039C9B|nr:FHA domain-containing protein [Microbacterium protaetiae]